MAIGWDTGEVRLHNGVPVNGLRRAVDRRLPLLFSFSCTTYMGRDKKLPKPSLNSLKEEEDRCAVQLLHPSSPKCCLFSSPLLELSTCRSGSISISTRRGRRGGRQIPGEITCNSEPPPVLLKAETSPSPTFQLWILAPPPHILHSRLIIQPSKHATLFSSFRTRMCKEEMQWLRIPPRVESGMGGWGMQSIEKAFEVRGNRKI
jgi:hypothetical protein